MIGFLGKVLGVGPSILSVIVRLPNGQGLPLPKSIEGDAQTETTEFVQEHVE